MALRHGRYAQVPQSCRHLKKSLFPMFVFEIFTKRLNSKMGDNSDKKNMGKIHVFSHKEPMYGISRH